MSQREMNRELWANQDDRDFLKMYDKVLQYLYQNSFPVRECRRAALKQQALPGLGEVHTFNSGPSSATGGQPTEPVSETENKAKNKTNEVLF